jgi:hypothetical protein
MGSNVQANRTQKKQTGKFGIEINWEQTAYNLGDGN